MSPFHGTMNGSSRQVLFSESLKGQAASIGAGCSGKPKMDSVIAFGARLLRWSADIDVHGHHSLRVASELLVTEVKAAHGEYRAGYNWPALATETVADRKSVV